MTLAALIGPLNGVRSSVSPQLRFQVKFRDTFSLRWRRAIP